MTETRDQTDPQKLDLRAIADRPLFVIIALYAALATLVPVTWLAVQSVANRNYENAVLFAIIVSLGVLLVFFLRHEGTLSITVALPENEFGPSPFDAKENYLWTRQSDVDKICNEIEASIAPVVLAGPSGVGKSVLMTMVVNQLKKNHEKNSFPTTVRLAWKPEIIGKYDNGNLIFPALSMEHQSFRVLLVFDQFEQFLDSATEKQRKDFAAKLNKFVDERKFALEGESRIQGYHQVIFVVREDAYFRFRVFLHEARVEHTFRALAGIVFDSETGHDIRARLRRATKAPNDNVDKIMEELASKGQILPLEARIVGYHLNEIRIDRNDVPITFEIYRNELGGRDGVIRSYINKRIDSLSDPEAGLAVLSALAVGGLRRKRLDEGQLAYITHLEPAAVAKAVRDLKEVDLLREQGNTYMLIHDFISDRANDATGLRLNPIDRDNINYFTSVVNRQDAPENYSKPKERNGTTPPYLDPFYDPLFLTLGLVLLLRLVMPHAGLSSHDLLSQSGDGSAPWWMPGFDLYFFPVAFCILAWMHYVSQLHDHLLTRIHKDDRKGASHVLWVVACVGGIFTVFFPTFFLSLVFTAGVLVSFKIRQLSRLTGLADVSREHFKDVFVSVFWFNCLGLVASLGVIWLFDTTCGDKTAYFPYFGSLAVAVTIMSVAFSRDAHVSPLAARRLLSLMDRRT